MPVSMVTAVICAGAFKGMPIFHYYKLDFDPVVEKKKYFKSDNKH